jgi:hypothetical protein
MARSSPLLLALLFGIPTTSNAEVTEASAKQFMEGFLATAIVSKEYEEIAAFFSQEKRAEEDSMWADVQATERKLGKEPSRKAWQAEMHPFVKSILESFKKLYTIHCESAGKCSAVAVHNNGSSLSFAIVEEEGQLRIGRSQVKLTVENATQ